MKKLDITEIVNNYLCHSCGSCDAMCGHDSISFISTTGGYVFPKINYDTCTNCGLCYDVCPGDHLTEEINYDKDPFVGTINNILSTKATNSDIYNNAQSGGAVTAILKYLFEANKISAAVVTTMSTDGNLNSVGNIIYSSAELKNSQKSKYIPTSINKLIPKLLKIDGTVAIVGLSCHFEGIENLENFKKKLSHKIIKIGLICDRVLTESSIDFFAKKMTREKISNFTFRDTTNTKYPGDMTVVSEEGKLFKMDKVHRILMKNYFTPLRCRLCFNKMNVFADIVIGDPHGITEIDKNGESLIITRTKLGLEIINEVIYHKILISKNINFNDMIRGQGIEEKKVNFSAYYHGWEKLGKKMPKYPESIKYSIKDVSNKKLRNAIKDLKLSLYIDSFDSREELLKSANLFYAKKLIIYRTLILLSKIKKILLKGLTYVNRSQRNWTRQ